MTETPDLTPETRAIGLRMPFGQRGWIITGLAAIGAGMALNWGWLTAIGAAPLILGLAPCAVMCATGYCVMCRSKSCDTKSAPTEKSGITRD